MMLQPEDSSLVCTLCECIGAEGRAFMTVNYCVTVSAAHSLTSLYFPTHYTQSFGQRQSIRGVGY